MTRPIRCFAMVVYEIDEVSMCGYVIKIQNGYIMYLLLRADSCFCEASIDSAVDDKMMGDKLDGIVYWNGEVFDLNGRVVSLIKFDSPTNVIFGSVRGFILIFFLSLTGFM